MFKSLKKAIFNLEDITVKEDMSVHELQEQFFKVFGTHIKVYKSTNTGGGAQIAPDNTILKDLKGDNKIFKEIFIKKSNITILTQIKRT